MRLNMERVPQGLNAPLMLIAAFCERVLRESGFTTDSCARYAVATAYATTKVAAFKAVA